MEINGIIIKELFKNKNSKLCNSNNSLETPTLLTSANFGKNSGAYIQASGL